VASYTVAHLEIEGDILDYDNAYPDLLLAMEPMGIALPKDRQSRQLRVRIGKKETVLTDKAIDELYAWLGDHGARRRIEVDQMEPPEQTDALHRFVGITPGCGWAMRNQTIGSARIYCNQPPNAVVHLR